LQPSLAPAFVVRAAAVKSPPPSGPVGNFFLARCEPNYSPPSNLGELEKFYTLMPDDRYFIARHVATGLAAGIVVILY
jgi:hypothetical protein